MIHKSMFFYSRSDWANIDFVARRTQKSAHFARAHHA